MKKRLSAPATRRLEDLLRAVGPSGYEAEPARIWRKMAEEFAEVTADAAGNSLAEVQGASPDVSPRVLLCAHIDEIGLVVNHIDDDGFIYVKEIGGWDPAVLVGQRVTILGTKGPVPGVLVRVGTHLMTEEEQEEPIHTKDLWIDIGVKSKAEARKLVRIGDPAVIDVAPLHLPNRRLASRALDNRVGSFVVLEALRAYSASPGFAHVVAAANTQEEFSGGVGGGASIVARRVRPDLAIVVDMTFAADHPNITKERLPDCALGTGPVIARGGVTSPRAFELIEKAAKRLGIDYRIDAIGGQSSTDADVVALGAAEHAVATALVSIPVRYVHTPNEVIALDDIAATIELLAEVCRMVKKNMNWVP